MAPEQAKGEINRIGPWSDQYGTAVVLYEMLTGAVPFDGPAYGVMYEIVHNPPPPPSRHRADLDPKLEAICLRALAKQPDERFPSCLEFGTALYAWLRDQPAPSQPLAGALRQAANILPRAFTNAVGMKFALIPAGAFLMGTPENSPGGLSDQNPQHLVRITRPFYLSAHPVTQEQFERVMGTNPSRFAATGRYKNRVVGLDTGPLPVENITWDEAVAFCQKLSDFADERRVGRTYRLPTEAEWEYACRAGTTTNYCYGDDATQLGAFAWYCDNSGGITHAVAEKKPNAFGLYDMHGNVWEWCADFYDENYYPRSPLEDPPGPETGNGRVLRGGSWNFSAATCRAALRDHDVPGSRSDSNGFRVAAWVDMRVV
jgi:formylglycine-generating enzyme required for sulfatase activity